MWELLQKHWRDAVEILLLTFLLYQGYRFLRATRGARILTGLLMLMLGLTVVSQLLDLEVMNWLLSRFSVFLAIGLVVLFQPELRRVLAELGSHRFFAANSDVVEYIDQLLEGMVQLSHRRCGALIAIQRGIDLKPYAETGVRLDSVITPELLNTIFHPKTALHDGGLIIDQGRLAAAACVFPVSQKEMQDRSLGLRHRAAVGIAEETDAIILVVSEETGALSIAYRGKLEHGLEEDVLRVKLQKLLFGEGKEDEDGDEKEEANG